MNKSDRNFITSSIEKILDKDMPNELKADLIYKNIIEVIVEDLKGQYERLMFVNKNIVN